MDPPFLGRSTSKSSSTSQKLSFEISSSHSACLICWLRILETLWSKCWCSRFWEYLHKYWYSWMPHSDLLTHSHLIISFQIWLWFSFSERGSLFPWSHLPFSIFIVPFPALGRFLKVKLGWLLGSAQLCQHAPWHTLPNNGSWSRALRFNLHNRMYVLMQVSSLVTGVLLPPFHLASA